MEGQRWTRGGVDRLARTVAVAALSILLSPGQAAAEGGSSRVLHYLTTSPELAGDPGGARSRLDRLGIGLQLFANQFLAWKPVGGASPASTSGYSGSYDLFALVDAEELAGWPGLDVLLHVKGQYDRNVNGDVGALSDPIDDADFDEPIYVDELWLQQSILHDRISLRIGFLEQQTLYDRNAYANSEDRQFLATFLDNNPVVPLPNGLGAAVILRPARWLEVAIGAGDADNVPRRSGFDTAFDGVDSLTGYLELAFHTWLPEPGGRGQGLRGSWRLGTFVDGRERPVFGSTRTERGHWGAWISADQLVFRERGGGEQGLGLFGRFGYADPHVNVLAWFWSVGLQYSGLLPTRDRDVLGVGAYQAIGSRRFRDEIDPRFDRETGIEVYYELSPVPWLAVTADLQYAIDPGAIGAFDDALVLALRFRIRF